MSRNNSNGAVSWMDSQVETHYKRTQWAHFAAMLLGAWLIAGRFSLDYQSAALARSDLVSGFLVILFAALSLSPHRNWPRWANALVALWLLCAPLVFWAPTSAAYTNDTVAGIMLIVFSVLVPSTPGLIRSSLLGGPEVPPGWSFNPSSWAQRAPIIALAFTGFVLARYLSSYQLGHIAYPWDPFFGDGTQRTLESDVSKAFPISDASLGAVSYLIEALTGFLGDRRRWRTMPWLVVFFGIMIVPPGVVSIVLIILQPLAVGAWCTICLLTAFVMLLMVAPAADEVLATVQFLWQSKKNGKSLWRTFWLGGGNAEAAAPMAVQPKLPLRELFSANSWGLSFSWSLLACAVLGAGLLFAPWLTGSEGAAAKSDYLTGALVITFAIIPLGEVARPLRLMNVLFGLWLVTAAWLLPGSTQASSWIDAVIGGLLIVLSFRRGQIKESFGAWNKYLI